jgi:hypothetical protein
MFVERMDVTSGGAPLTDVYRKRDVRAARDGPRHAGAGRVEAEDVGKVT